MLWYLLVPIIMATNLPNVFATRVYDRYGGTKQLRRAASNGSVFLVALFLAFVLGRTASLMFSYTWVAVPPDDHLIASWSGPSPYLKKCFDKDNNEFFCYYYKKMNGASVYSFSSNTGANDEEIFEEDRADYVIRFSRPEVSSVAKWFALFKESSDTWKSDLHVPIGAIKLAETDSK